MSETFRPVKNDPPTGILGKVKFYGRMLLDFQILTIYTDIKKVLPQFKGKVLDVGCGQSPYNFLLNQSEVSYTGIDIADASNFDYANSNIIPFDGKNIPFGDNSFDALICTEVLEHVYNYQALVDEMYRVCKPGASAIITIPFSARYHYIPYDYFRYTPGALSKIFSKFSVIEIVPRGTDIVTIVSKIIVLFARNLVPTSLLKILLLPFWILLSPLLVVAVIIGHVSRILNAGSSHDPLGYSIKLIK